MTEDEDRARAMIDAFLQNKNMEQKQDYLARGRRFARLDVGQLNAGWITALRGWLAHKDQSDELMMDDMACELQLRRLEPPYGAVEQELIGRFTRTSESEREEKIRSVVQEICEFMNKNEGRCARS